MRSQHVSAMQSDQHDSEWYRPDKTEVAPVDLLALMEMAGVDITIDNLGTVHIYFDGNSYRVPQDEDGTWERNAYEIWQWVSRKGPYGR